MYDKQRKLDDGDVFQIFEQYPDCTDILPFFRAKYPDLINDNLLLLLISQEKSLLLAIFSSFTDTPEKFISLPRNIWENHIYNGIGYCLEYPHYSPNGRNELDLFYKEIQLFKSPMIFDLLETKEQAYDLENNLYEAKSSIITLSNEIINMAREYVSKNKLHEKIYKKAKKTLIDEDIQAIKEHRDGSILGGILNNHINNHIYNDGFLALSEFEQKMYRLSQCDKFSEDKHLDCDELDIKAILEINSHTLDDAIGNIARDLIWDCDFDEE